METYIIRVNGISYEVEVEKKGQTGQDESPAQTMQSAQKAAPQTIAASACGQEVTSGAAGKIWKVLAKEGTHLKRGDSILILEAMKMEIPVVSPVEGRLTSLCVSEGDSVEAGQMVAVVA